jgi:molybdenum cofactor cytidylyltransferase
MSTVAVILAAESSPGSSGSKYLLDVRGVAVLDRVVSEAVAWPVDEVLVVLGANADRLEEECDLSGVSVLVDPEWDEGSSSPIRAVLDLLSRDRAVQRCVLARGDQPGVSAAIVSQLLAASDRADAQVVAPKYRYARGWPLVVDASLWGVFLGLEGELDVFDVVATHAHGVEEVWFDRLQPIIVSSADDVLRVER